MKVKFRGYRPSWVKFLLGWYRSENGVTIVASLLFFGFTLDFVKADRK